MNFGEESGLRLKVPNGPTTVASAVCARQFVAADAVLVDVLPPPSELRLCMSDNEDSATPQLDFEEVAMPRGPGTAASSTSLQRAWDPRSLLLAAGAGGEESVLTYGSSRNFPFAPGGLDRTDGTAPRQQVVPLPAGFDWDALPDTAPGMSRCIDFATPHRTVPLRAGVYSQIPEPEPEPLPTADPLSSAVQVPHLDEATGEAMPVTSTSTTMMGAADGVTPAIESAFRDDGSLDVFASHPHVDRRRQRSLDEVEDEEEDMEVDAELLASEEDQHEHQTTSTEKSTTKSEETAALAPAITTTITTTDADDIDSLLAALAFREDAAPLPIGAAASKPQHITEWSVIDTTDVSEFSSLVPEPAHSFPFELDVFQKRAIYHLDRRECVFVAAHTSAGKTVVAEYAIALAKKHCTRAIYTSPIKALSNQKFRDFKETFGDVGLITGDVSINPEASCLIVTTEILRSMLYRGADLIRDIEWVIFDEVHYVNDLERGVVWEEVIIMLPDHVNMIMLSATVPNALEFADWIGRTKRKKIHVTVTPKRPVPLEHYVYVSGEIHLLVDSSRNFQRQGYQAALDLAKAKREKSDKKGRSTFDASSHWSKLVSFLGKKSLLPAVVFVFSKRHCEDLAYGLSGTDLTGGARERNEIVHFMDSSLNRLRAADRQLPQILRIKDLLKRGIGIHHSGLLPIVKEMVEILFARGLVKVLFATETFAMGVNMPARCVVFSGIRKHDGRSFRELLPGEYTQMSGRAGRRGKDPVGTVILNVIDSLPEASVLTQMMLGTPTKLESQFRLTYNMILNLLRIEDLRVEDMMKRSFAESPQQKSLPRQQALLYKGEARLSQFKPPECIVEACPIEEYFSTTSSLETIEKKIRRFVVSSPQGNALLHAGRVVVLQHPRFFPERTFGAIVTVTRKETGLEIFALVIDPKTHECDVKQVRPSCIVAICKTKISVDGVATFGGPLGSQTIGASTRQLSRLLDQAQSVQEYTQRDLKINDVDFADMLFEKTRLESLQTASPCHRCPRVRDHLADARKKAKLARRVERLRFELSDANLQLMPDFEKRLVVLQQLQYVDAELAVMIKGRVAREINTCSELVTTELIFENAFSSLTPPELVAIVSALICQEKANTSPDQLPPQLRGLWDTAEHVARRIAAAQTACGMQTDEDEFVRANLCPTIMEVVFEWARQVAFSDICKMTDVQEGSIVRYIVRLEESMKEVKSAARVIGDPTLFQLADQASALIRRDIVFAASLYVA